MKKNLLLLTGFLCLFQLLYAQSSPKREFRGAWVASYFGIDWPNRNQSPQQQRDAFIAIANHHQQTGITAMFVQVRSQSDALYPSEVEPWGFYLTPLKLDGNEPAEAWDPMQFMIDECHKRGIEFHAWLNPYRAIGNIANAKYFSPEHVVRKHPEMLMSTTHTEKILDPGLPEVRERINAVVAEIVSKYDVDGIQFDDYFYPNNTLYNDDATFEAYNRGFTNRGDWRRDNINLMVEMVSKKIKELKPWVEFGISPTGIWRNGGEGSATSGLQHYATLYGDSRKWLQEGWVDYLCPQVYWYIGQPGADYKVLIPWWNNNANGRLIYIGMAGYKVGTAGQGLFTTDRTQIPQQVRMNRDAAYPNIHGQAIYNTSSLRTNSLNFRDSLQQRFYNVPALQPLMPWIDNTAPQPATTLTASYNGTSVTLSWANPAEAAAEMDKVKRQVIYRSEQGAVDLENANNIVAITNTSVSTFEDVSVEQGKVYYYQVTTLDRLHNESTPTNVAMTCTSVPEITDCVAALAFCEVAAGSYTIPALIASSNCQALTYSYTITGATNRTGTGNDASGAFLPGVSTIHWLVTDAAGNTANCQTEVTINTNPVATIPDAFVLPVGVLANTVYKGYAPAETITLTPVVSGGTSPYTYSWSTGTTEATANVSPVTTTNYLLTVTDENGCQATADKEIQVVDVRAGKNNNKVKVCHKAEPQITIEIEAADVSDHLAHGDMLGGCSLTLPATSAINAPSVVERSIGKLLIRAYPNPSSSYFTIVLQGAKNNPPSAMRVMDIMGRVVEIKNNLQHNQTLIVGEKLQKGIYFIEISNGAEKTLLKLVKQ